MQTLKEDATTQYNDLKAKIETQVTTMRTIKDAMKELEVSLTADSEEVISLAKTHQLTVDLDAEERSDASC